MWKTKSKLAAVVTVSSAFLVYQRSNFKKSEESEKEQRTYASIDRLNLNDAASASRDLVTRKKVERNIPGIVAGVSWKGKNVWVEGFGFSDIEVGAKCNESTIMRIASVSKCITMLLVGKLVEDGKLDLNKSIYFYLKDKFPEKYWNGEKVDITVRQLASHTGGIRHYNFNKVGDDCEKKLPVKDFMLKEKFNTVYEALDIFKNDELVSKPGTEFKYSTYGYTLLSAVVEQVLPKGESFGSYLMKMCRDDLGMESTFLDEFEPIIYNRSKNYRKVGEEGKLMNAPYVDFSYKWAGGGLLSNVPDLLKFANVLLYSYIGSNNGSSGYLKRSTIETLWKPTENTRLNMGIGYTNVESFYALGFRVIKNGKEKFACGTSPPFENIVYHGGGNMGSSSYLLIVPEHELVVAIVCNLGNSAILPKLAVSIAKNFVKNIVNADSNDSVVEI